MKRLRQDLSVILLVEFYHSKVLFSSQNITQSYLRKTLAVPSKMYLTPWKLVSLENSDTLGADDICSSNVGSLGSLFTIPMYVLVHKTTSGDKLNEFGQFVRKYFLEIFLLL